MQTPRTEFAQALRAISTERGLDSDVILDTIKQAIIAAYRRDARDRGEEDEGFEYDVTLDPRSGEAQVFAWPEGEEDQRKDVTPPGFGRIAAQTAKQVILQKIREAEKGAIMDEYQERVGSLISGMILRFDGPDVRVDLGRSEGLMPASERVPNERLSPNQRLSFLMKEIKDTPRGKLIVLSRSDAQFVRKLFEREVPEIGSGSVEIKALAREAGVRTKIVVASSQPGVDPVGSCVGQKGVRVQAVTNELGGERVDIIPFTENESELIKLALAPAEDIEVKLRERDGEKVAEVLAPEDQISIVIGREGQNARLVKKLTGWRIEAISTGEGTSKNEKTEEVKEEKKANEQEEKASEKTVEESAEVTVPSETEIVEMVKETVESSKKENDDTPVADEADAESSKDES